jgi:four helix bundle protein
MASFSRFTQIYAWQKAHALALEVYELTAPFPRDEMFGLTSQARRAAVSVSANIAEGFKRNGTADKRRFYNIAAASLEELQAELMLARDLGYFPASYREDIFDQADEAARYLNRWTRHCS